MAFNSYRNFGMPALGMQNNTDQDRNHSPSAAYRRGA